MNAKETIKAIQSCASVEEVQKFLLDETRKTVLVAGQEKIAELNSVEPETTISSAPKEVKESSYEEKRIAEFKRKTQHLIPCYNIESFAHSFFGEKLKSVNTKDCIVTIKLTSGTSFTQRGN